MFLHTDILIFQSKFSLDFVTGKKLLVHTSVYSNLHLQFSRKATEFRENTSGICCRIWVGSLDDLTSGLIPCMDEYAKKPLNQILWPNIEKRFKACNYCLVQKCLYCKPLLEFNSKHFEGFTKQKNSLLFLTH